MWRIRKVWLFARIVWRRYEGERMPWRLSWEVAGCVWYPGRPKKGLCE